MSDRLKRIIFYVFTVIELALAFGMYYLQALTHKKAGVNHYLYFMKDVYIEKYINTKLTGIYLVLAVILIIIMIVYMIKKSSFSRIGTAGFIIFLAWAVVFIISIKTKIFLDLLVYPFLVLAMGINVILGFLGALLVNKR